MRAEKGLAVSHQRLQTNLDEIVNGALFEVESDGMVIVKDIEFFSMCEHHMLPFYGKAHVAYLPDEEGYRTEQDPAHRRHVRAPASGAGADDAGDCRHDPARC